MIKYLNYPGFSIEKYKDKITFKLFDEKIDFTPEEFLTIMKELNGNFARYARYERERPAPPVQFA